MPLCPRSVATSRFESSLPPGRYDLIFRVAFGGYGAAARYFGVNRETVWRWRHGRSPLPDYVIQALEPILRKRVALAHEAQTEWRYLRDASPKPPRPLSGCCADYVRKSEIPRF
jgi:hypothetical protein